MKRITLREWTIPLALLSLVALTYALVIPLLGLYGDDWPYLWVKHAVGARGYIDFVAWDRPFSAWIYLLATPILGEHSWAYHLFLAGLRWVDAVLIWWVIKRIWPERGLLAAMAACLLVVYPGFRQQPIPLEFMLHFSVLALFLLSLGMMLLSACEPRPLRRWLLTGIGMLGAASMFSLEYFVGLELVRPVLLWLVLRDQPAQPDKRVVKILQHWLPYLLVWLGFLIWRVFIFKFPSYQPSLLSGLAAAPAAALLELGGRILTDLKTVVLDAWRNTLILPKGRTLLLSGGVALASMALVSAALWRIRQREQALPEKFSRRLEPLLLGLLAVLVAGVPFWVTSLPVAVTFPWDRSTLAFLPGVSLMTAGLIELFQPRLRPALLALLVFLAVGFQIQNGLSYRTESNKLADFFWQLSWRAPALKAGTVVLSEQIPLYYYGDNGLTPPLNWTYAPEQASEKQVYNFLDIDERLGTTLPALKEGLDIKRSYRSFRFTGSTSNILMVYAHPGSCLRVLSKADETLPNLPPKLSQALELSHLDQIVTVANPAAVPPAQVIGAEPAHTWCYIFEKASLAQQMGDWLSVIKLAELANQQKLVPTDPSEYLPFIEAYARTGKLDQARTLSDKLFLQDNLRSGLCAAWQRAKLPSSGNSNWKEPMAAYQCKQS